jgi:hypothetical protein
MPRTPKAPQLYSLVCIDVDSGHAVVTTGLAAEAVKAQLADVEHEEHQTVTAMMVFAGPQVKWANEIALYVDEEPTQQPTADTPKRKRRTKAEMAAAKAPLDTPKPTGKTVTAQ